jgi:hypothetical protein
MSGATACIVTRVTQQIPATQNTTVLLPFLGKEKIRGQEVEGQVEAEERRVLRPRRLAIRTLQKRIVRNDALQCFAGPAEGG